MADIFISYKREQRPLAAALATQLEGEGLTVWWDRELVGGEEFSPAILEQLDKASCVVGLWSEPAAASDWVKQEFARALNQNKLIPCRLDDHPLDPGFSRLHAISLYSPDAFPSARGFADLVQAIRIKMNVRVDLVSPELARRISEARSPVFRPAGAPSQRTAPITAAAQKVETNPDSGWGSIGCFAAFIVGAVLFFSLPALCSHPRTPEEYLQTLTPAKIYAYQIEPADIVPDITPDKVLDPKAPMTLRALSPVCHEGEAEASCETTFPISFSSSPIVTPPPPQADLTPLAPEEVEKLLLRARDLLESSDAASQKRAVELLQLAAPHDGRAANNLGWCFDLGVGVMRNVNEARRWYEAALGHGNREARTNLGTLYTEEPRTQDDMDKGMALLKQAALDNDPVAMTNMALQLVIFEKGISDFDGEALLHAAALRGVAEAWTGLALLSADGPMTGGKLHEMRSYLEKAVQAGSQSARMNIIMLQLAGLDTPPCAPGCDAKAEAGLRTMMASGREPERSKAEHLLASHLMISANIDHIGKTMAEMDALWEARKQKLEEAGRLFGEIGDADMAADVNEDAAKQDSHREELHEVAAEWAAPHSSYSDSHPIEDPFKRREPRAPEHVYRPMGIP